MAATILTAPAPIVAEATWRAVMAEAGYRCECTGGCGRTHAKDPGRRCKHEHKPWLHLLAAPASPTGNPHRDVAAELVAYCPTCFDGCLSVAKRAAVTAARAAAAEAPSLFDFDGPEEGTP